MLIALVWGGCRTAYKPEVRRGQAVSRPSPAAVLFPVPCNSTDDKCKDGFGDAIKGLIASELEFAGFRIIDAEKLVRDARTREDFSASLSRFRDQILAAKSRSQVGSIFEDLPPEARRELLQEARADGLVTASINMLARGTGNNWIVEVQVRYGAAPDGELIWVARCKHESYWNEKDSWSIEEATRCALKGALGKG
jgi:hypothetical protein